MNPLLLVGLGLAAMFLLGAICGWALILGSRLTEPAETPEQRRLREYVAPEEWR